MGNEKQKNGTKLRSSNHVPPIASQFVQVTHRSLVGVYRNAAFCALGFHGRFTEVPEPLDNPSWFKSSPYTGMSSDKYCGMSPDLLFDVSPPT